MKTFIYKKKRYRIKLLYNIKWNLTDEPKQSCEAEYYYKNTWHTVKNPQILKELRKEYDRLERKESLYMGQTHIMSNNMKATIIAYRKYNDIDVEFEDGTVVWHTSIHKFNTGQIFHPTINKKYLNYLKRKEKVCPLDKEENYILYTYG